MLEAFSQCLLGRFKHNSSTPEVFIDRETVAQAEKVVPYDQLLKATQETERVLTRRAEQVGVSRTLCSVSRDVIVTGGPFGHIFEHALIASLETQFPPDVQFAGVTEVAGVKQIQPLDPLLVDHHYQARIYPPSTVKIKQARVMVWQAVDNIMAQAQRGGGINLQNVFS